MVGESTWWRFGYSNSYAEMKLSTSPNALLRLLNRGTLMASEREMARQCSCPGFNPDKPRRRFGIGTPGGANW